MTVQANELPYDVTALLGLVAFLVLIATYLIVLVRDKPSSPHGVVVIMLSSILMRREARIYFLMLQGSAIVFTASLVFKYLLDMKLAYKAFEIISELLVIPALSILLYRYLQHRRTVGPQIDGDSTQPERE